MAAKTQRWTSCNVLAPAAEGRTLWSFSRKGDQAALEAEKRFAAGARLPAEQVGKTLRQTWQPRLNIAWLPADKVFLRVVELPPAEPAEVPALIEFQLEKLSPLPAAQSVWTYELVAGGPTEPITAIVAIVDREVVEAQLKDLEAAGYRPDRLELPALRELLAVMKPGDGVYILACQEPAGIDCLVAWWGEGRLRHLSLGHFSDDSATGDRLVDALRRTTWAAEVEGWLPASLDVTLIAEASLAARLELALKDFAGRSVTLRERLTPSELASVTATARAQANLVPPEVLARYRQEFVDRLWMRALGSVALAYVLVVLGYLAALNVLDYQKGRVDHEIALNLANYTKAQQLKARLEILQEQVNLKFAALDCWKAAAEALPESMTLNSVTFQRGKKLGLMGSVPNDEQGKVTTYNAALAKAEVNGRPLFTKVVTKSIQAPAASRPDLPASWSLECEINRRDLE